MNVPLMQNETQTRSDTKMQDRVQAFDWAVTPLGSQAAWPQSLRTAVSICLASNFPMIIFWGPEYIQIYNDAYVPILGAKHPQGLGQSAKVCWAEIWTDILPLFQTVHETGEAIFIGDTPFFIERFGFIEEAYFTFSYSPILDESGQIGGVLEPVTETTSRVLSERRMGVLRDLAAQVDTFHGEATAIEGAMATLRANHADISLSLLYLLDAPSAHMHLQGSSGFASLPSTIPQSIDLAATDAFSCAIAATVKNGEETGIDTIDAQLGALPGGPWPEPTHHVLALPLLHSGQTEPFGVLVTGISPRLSLDVSYRDFLRLAASQVAMSIANARLYSQEQQRAESLAELDRAKTTFFNNISHEFRTPLTLMAGPVADSLADRVDALAPAQRERLEIVQRNTARLLKLVNTLLNVSRLEAGRMQAEFQPTDLAKFTQVLASNFASAAEQSRLQLIIQCTALNAPVYVDQRLWEQVAINLIANAFKYTMHGRIAITIGEEAEYAVFAVEDTGVGIPQEALPHLFERFYRVPGATGRTHEGTGIGLSLVHELVQLHGGTITVESEVGHGSRFTVKLPFGTAHLPADQIHDHLPSDIVFEYTDSMPLKIEQWQSVPSISRTQSEETQVPKILLVEDNQDMRAYLYRLLEPHYQVHIACNGLLALEAIQAKKPDLVLSDVMMPELNGFELLHRLRINPETRTIPFILLSARAGEEATVEGLDAGADDYLIKPFSARELLSRVSAHLELVRLRHEEASLLETNQRMNEFLQIASHEMRTPLSILLGNIQFAQHIVREGMQSAPGHLERNQAESISEMLQDAESGGKRLNRLVADMLDISRVDGDRMQFNMAPADLQEVLFEAVKMVQHAWPERVITLAIPSEQAVMITMDGDRIAQVLINYITNALKYCPADMPITVSVEIQPDAVRVAVQDHGPGIPKEEQQRIWERFYRVDGIAVQNSSQVGLGLGLYLSRSFVTRHGGEVGVESEVGQGTMFWFTLPRDPALNNGT